jgi:hypothetical protein
MPLALTVTLVVFGIVALAALVGYLIDKSADHDGIS